MFIGGYFSNTLIKCVYGFTKFVPDDSGLLKMAFFLNVHV